MSSQQRQRQEALSAVLLLLVYICHQAAAARDILLPLKPGQYNPSLVVYEGAGWLVARSTELKWDTSGLKWIMNRAYLCKVNITDWSPISCHDFDPWRGDYGNQCRWGSAEWRVPWEAWGVDDTKLFTWPGRGLWAITGRRPQQPSDSIHCPQPVVWRQWLVQLAPEGQQVDQQLFDYVPVDPANVTWGQKPGGKAPAAAAAPALVKAGKRMLQRWFPITPVATAAQGSSGPSSSSRAEPGSKPYSRYSRKYRQRHRYSAAGTVRVGYPAVDEDSLIPETRVSHHFKEHRRPGAQKAATITTDSQEQEQQQRPQGVSVQQSQPSSPVQAVVPSGDSTQTYIAAAQQEQQARTQPPTHGGTRAAGSGHKTPVTAASKAGHTSSKASDGSIDAADTKHNGDTHEPDTWDKYWGHAPVSLAISDAKAVYGHDHSISEKNWMPFLWQGQLYVTYQLVPRHRVYLLHPNGTASPAAETDPGPAFAGLGQHAARLHGGPPLVYVDYHKYLTSLNSPWIQAATVHQGPHYLGVGHYWLPVGGGDGRTYHHYLIKMEAAPPFRILQVSAELQLQYNQHYKRVAFVSGIDLALLPAGAASSSGSSGRQLYGQDPQSTQQLLPHILVSYGSGDWESHVKIMTLDDVEALFMQGPYSTGLDARSSSTDITVQGGSLSMIGGTGYYSMITRNTVKGSSSSSSTTAADVQEQSSGAGKGEEDPYAGLDHADVHNVLSQQAGNKTHAAVAAVLKTAGQEVAAAEADPRNQ